MSQFPPDDDALVTYLRRHRPEPPPAAPDLEARVMAQVKLAPVPSRRWARWTGAIAALSAGTLLLWGGGRWLSSPAGELEMFVVDVWVGTTTGPTSRPAPENWMRADLGWSGGPAGSSPEGRFPPARAVPASGESFSADR